MLSTISVSQSFLHQLAYHILARADAQQLPLPHFWILLPNRRACRSLRDIFLEIGQGKPMLLPRIQPIGELDEATLLLENEASATLPPAIAPLRRRFTLMQLVQRFHQHGHHSDEQAFELAEQLGTLLDDATREGLDLGKLAELVPDNLSTHWQRTLDFLRIISHEWPRILEAEGMVDAAYRQSTLLRDIAKRWSHTPPAFPIIAAGSTGSQSATAALLGALAKHAHTEVVLPGLDLEMDEKQWQQIGPTHPQYVLKQLLARMEQERANVTLLPVHHAHSTEDTKPRRDTIRAIMAPPEATAHWREWNGPVEEGLHGVSLVEADTQLDEARLIGVMMRELLQVPQRTIALVTPDRTLARMVSAQMQRYGIALDDSAGKVLRDSVPGCFLLLVLELITSQYSPSAMLALLRHPLAAAGMKPHECRQLSRELELELLRGFRRSGGLNALAHATKNKNLAALLHQLHDRTDALSELLAPHRVGSLRELVSAHIGLAEWLASTDAASGDSRLWQGEAGSALARTVAELYAQAEHAPAIDPTDYASMLEQILAAASYYPTHQGEASLHPRLHILSPMEARMQHYDVMILGGMNEGSWPASATPDPWMSRPMREAFGLSSPERGIGQSAHDVLMLCHAPRVIWTRAKKVEGAPTVPSRWWVRLETLVKGKAPDVLKQIAQQQAHEAAMRWLDAPMPLAALSRPNPKPPLDARVRTLRITGVDTWLRDPYVHYAANILKLRKLEDIDQQPGAADFGNVVHKALELFAKRYPQKLPEHALDELIAAGREAFADFIDRPSVACLWWPRFESIAGWILTQERERRAQGVHVLSEVKGTWEFVVDGKPFTLTTRIDRLEQLPGGAFRVVDYKTGSPPANKFVKAGLANQLPLGALVATKGVLQDVSLRLAQVDSLEYWKLAGDEDSSDITTIEPTLEEAEERLVGLIRRFDDVHEGYTANPDPTYGLTHHDYVQLVRSNEWEEG
jgi:ATP-dependent helicase/nuclease subunit B